MAIKVVFGALKKLEVSQIVRLSGLLISSPLFSLMTLVATYKTFKISDKIYPQTHHRNGRGNAFRHAFWCCLIMMYCCKISSPKKSLIWCKKITDMHEDLFVNEPLLRAMDLHNNKIGMDLFMRMLKGIHRQFFETSFFIDELKLFSQNAILITSEKEIIENQMVITEEVD